MRIHSLQRSVRSIVSVSVVLSAIALVAGCSGGGGGGGGANNGTLVVQVTVPNGTTPIAGAQVQVRSAGSSQVACSGASNQNGQVSCAGLAVGSYDLAAQVGIFTAQAAGIALAAGQTLNQVLAIPGDPGVAGSGAKRIGAVTNDPDDLLVAYLKSLGFKPVLLDGVSLTNSSTVDSYDYLFFPSRPSDLDGSNVPYAQHASVVNNLQSFLNRGSRIYFADWSGDYLESVFPDAVNFYDAPDASAASQVGAEADVTATVNDSSLAALLGSSTLMLHLEPAYLLMLDTGVIPGTGAIVRTLLQGERLFQPPGTPAPAPVSLGTGPLVVEFDHGAGRVTFSSAGGSLPPLTDEMKALLRAIIFR